MLENARKSFIVLKLEGKKKNQKPTCAVVPIYTPLLPDILLHTHTFLPITTTPTAISLTMASLWRSSFSSLRVRFFSSTLVLKNPDIVQLN